MSAERDVCNISFYFTFYFRFISKTASYLSNGVLSVNQSDVLPPSTESYFNTRCVLHVFCLSHLMKRWKKLCFGKSFVVKPHVDLIKCYCFGCMIHFKGLSVEADCIRYLYPSWTQYFLFYLTLLSDEWGFSVFNLIFSLGLFVYVTCEYWNSV